MTLAYVELSGPQDLDAATAAVLRARPDALFVGINPVAFPLHTELADFARLGKAGQRRPAFGSKLGNRTSGEDKHRLFKDQYRIDVGIGYL